MAAVGAGQLNINVLIQATDKTTRVVRDIADNVQNSTSRMRRAFDALKDVGKIAAGMLVRDMVQGATAAYGEALQLGGQIDTLKASFERLVAASGDTTLTLEKLRAATKGTVSDVDLLRAANMALMLGIGDATDDMAGLFEAAMKLGHAMGIDTTKAVESLTIGLGRQSKLVLDNLGITFQASEAYGWFAQQIGVSADQLTENEKKLAWQKFAIMKIIEKANELGDVISESQLANERWAASIENAKTSVGRFLGPLGMIAAAMEPLMPLISTMAGVMIPQLISAVYAKIAAFAAAKVAAVGLQGALLGILGPIGLVIAVATVLYMAWTQNWGGIRDKVMGAIEAIKQGIAAFTSWLTQGWTNLVNTLSTAWSNFWTGVQNFINDPIDTIQNAVTGLRDNMVARFQEVYDQTGNKWKATWEALKTIPVVGKILGAVEGLANSIFGVFGLSMDDVFNTWQSVWNSIQNFIRDPIGSIKNAISGLVNNIASRFQEVYEKTGDKWKATWEALKTIPGLGLILQAVEGIWNGINNIMGGWPAKAFEWGKKLIQSFIDGIKNMVSGVVDAVSGVADAIKNFLGLGSPARIGPLSELDKWGPALIKTYAEGIRHTVPELKRAVEYASQQVSLAASPEYVPVIGAIGRETAIGFSPAPAKIIQISGPLVYVEGSADEATAELASRLVLRELSKIVGV
jgi:phage-related protein